MQQRSAEDISQLVQPGRVHRKLYTDPEIFELEMQRIFGRAWIYVGHESQVKKPGDYFATRIGRRPVVMVRDDNGDLRVIHNHCAHRGARVVATEQGNAPEFTCCYHGWTYHLDGRIKGVPLNHGYPHDFDAKNPKVAMNAVKRVKSYEGRPPPRSRIRSRESSSPAGRRSSPPSRSSSRRRTERLRCAPR